MSRALRTRSSLPEVGLEGRRSWNVVGHPKMMLVQGSRAGRGAGSRVQLWTPVPLTSGHLSQVSLAILLLTVSTWVGFCQHSTPGVPANPLPSAPGSSWLCRIRGTGSDTGHNTEQLSPPQQSKAEPKQRRKPEELSIVKPGRGGRGKPWSIRSVGMES